jgi:hypothetical protein
MYKENKKEFILKLSPSIIAVISILFAAYSLWLNNKSTVELKKYAIFFNEKSKNYSDLVSLITNLNVFLDNYGNLLNDNYFDSTVSNKYLYFTSNLKIKIYTLSPFLSKNVFDTLSEKVRILNRASGMKIILMRFERTSNTDEEKKIRRNRFIKGFNEEEINILNTIEGKETSISKYFNELLEFITKNVFSELFSDK